MAAAHYKITIDRGESYVWQQQILDGNGAPFEWTDWTISSDVKLTYSDVAPVASFSVSTSAGGYVTLSLSSTQTAALTSASYVYDVLAEFIPTGECKYLLRGPVALTKTVTTSV